MSKESIASFRGAEKPTTIRNKGTKEKEECGFRQSPAELLGIRLRVCLPFWKRKDPLDLHREV